MGEGHGFVVVLGNDSRGLRSSEASEDEATFRAPRRLAAAPWRPGVRERRVLRPAREVARPHAYLMGSDGVPSEVASFIIC